MVRKFIIKNYQHNVLVGLQFIFLIMVSACSKGPKGDTGPTGPPGPQGSPGPAGQSGIAQVIYSDWLDVTYTPNQDSSLWTSTINAPKLTTDILSKGEVKIYVNLNKPSQPFISQIPYNDGVFNIGAVMELQKIHLSGNADFSTYTDNGEKIFQYRYLLVPGTEGARMMHKIDWNNYSEVKAYYHLED